jgi:hypothetical protein
MFFNSVSVHAYTVEWQYFWLPVLTEANMSQKFRTTRPSCSSTWNKLPEHMGRGINIKGIHTGFPSTSTPSEVCSIMLCYSSYCHPVSYSVFISFPKLFLIGSKEHNGMMEKSVRMKKSRQLRNWRHWFSTQQVIIWGRDKQYDSLYFNISGRYGELQQQSSPSCQWYRSG